MKGHHPTPDSLAETMVRRLFESHPPRGGETILYPGCGTAPFAEAVERVCEAEGYPVPEGVGVDSDAGLLEAARQRRLSHLQVVRRDFLSEQVLDLGSFEYVVGNPPYVPIGELSAEEKARYRARFQTATGRFDLYLLFFEQALNLLAPGGVLSFVTPEKWMYVQTASALRRFLSAPEYHVEDINHLNEDAFDGLVTYPAVTTIRKRSGRQAAEETSDSEGRGTTVRLRSGETHVADLPRGEASWAAHVRGVDPADFETGVTLGDVAIRISAGMATGADSVFVMKRDEVPSELQQEWVRPTLAGRELGESDDLPRESVLVCPYRSDGTLPSERDLGAFGDWARAHRERLAQRFCVQITGKPWYAWHETPPMDDLLRPKIVWKDIAPSPRFWVERRGDVVPRHSVYYLVPRSGVAMDDLLDYMNGEHAQKWLEAHCQKAANGFLRLQSRVLKALPVPVSLASPAKERQTRLFA